MFSSHHSCVNSENTLQKFGSKSLWTTGVIIVTNSQSGFCSYWGGFEEGLRLRRSWCRPCRRSLVILDGKGENWCWTDDFNDIMTWIGLFLVQCEPFCFVFVQHLLGGAANWVNLSIKRGYILQKTRTVRSYVLFVCGWASWMLLKCASLTAKVSGRMIYPMYSNVLLKKVKFWLLMVTPAVLRAYNVRLLRECPPQLNFNI